MRIGRGRVVLVSLDPTTGHEQRGLRPCVAVSDPEAADHQRYPLIAVVPLTGSPGEGALYPSIEPGESGLRKRSWALVDQVRAIDRRRVHRVYGEIAVSELAAIDLGLSFFLGLAV